MSSSANNNPTKWSNKWLCKHNDDNDKLFEKKSMEHRHCMKVWKEVEHQRVEEEARWKAEEEEKCKVEVEAWRNADVDVKACTEQVAWAQSSVMGLSKGKQPKVVVEVAEQAGGLAPCYGCLGAGAVCEMKAAGSSKAGKKEAWMQSLVVDKEEVDKEEEDFDMCGALTEVLEGVVVEMQNMAVESHAQVERVLGTLEEIQGCLDLEFTCEQLGDMQPMWQRKQEEVMSLQARKKKAQIQSLAAEDDKEDEGVNKEEEDCDTLGMLMEVLMAVVVEMWNMAVEVLCYVVRHE
ncbi:hypothetical protein PAXRUDRAFT_22602 [Paxillus rubicundulus Ve08.2h10]|uniref:Uncharacterized protein n=1 Tax=Paxillus rubicundulus Ve08.2h10 TaxID=930991 RepID=A0A0D0CMX2_9AGAM|nr:hypothetical protein PAXRUDRAFT_22602 [Paxillus rubicundulus Ve08.2h10]